ncbi:MAG: hypothetical protein GY847_30335 [Proteobacteria bacterium]|nr:hypothetical protein [Pseudomonadota bacterium]
MSPLKKRLSCAGVALGLLLVFFTHFGISAYYLNSSRMSADEGFYALAARNVMEGKLPYRDFAYTQMPLLPYLNGIVFELFGYGLTEQRIVNAVWATIGLLAIILALKHRLELWEPGLVAAFSVAASPHWTVMQAMGKTYGAAGMFLVLSAISVFTTYSLRWRTVAFAVTGTLAAGCRLSCAPVLAILGLVLFFEAKDWKERFICTGIPLGIAAITLLPFFAASLENALFFVWTYHLESIFLRPRLVQAEEWWTVSPAAILLLLTGILSLPFHIKKHNWTVIFLLMAGLTGITVPMMPRSAYGNYITPVVLVAASAGVLAIWTIPWVKTSPFRYAFWFLPALTFLHPLPVDTISTIRDSERAAVLLARDIPPGPILTPVTIVAVESGRSVIRGTDMGMFSAMRPRDRKKARILNLTTIPDLVDVVRKQRPAAIVKMKGNSVWNFKWAVPSLHRQPQNHYKKFTASIKKHYRSIGRFGHLEVLVPRTKQKP